MSNDWFQESSDGFYLAFGARPDGSPVPSSCWRLVCFDSITSTMDAARKWSAVREQLTCRSYSLNLEAPRPQLGESVVFLARSQSAGRGRQGNEWVSSLDSGLYLTYLWNSSLPVSALGGFSLAVGVAVSEALEHFGIQTQCKWPNDIVVSRGNDLQKIAGILVETWTDSEELSFVSTGIGVNLRSDSKVKAFNGICMEELGIGRGSEAELFEIVSQRVTALVNEFQSGGFSDILDRFERRSALRDKQVEILRSGVRKMYSVLGVAVDGGLRVRGMHNGSEEDVIYAGEVTLHHAYRS